jgi:hypothetical protein
LSHKEKLAGEAAREVARTDWKRQEEIREHLINKVFNESYTINFLYGKVKLTSGWAEQEEIDKVKNNKNIPEVVKKELIR